MSLGECQIFRTWGSGSEASGVRWAWVIMGVGREREVVERRRRGWEGDRSGGVGTKMDVAEAVQVWLGGGCGVVISLLAGDRVDVQDHFLRQSLIAG